MPLSTSVHPQYAEAMGVWQHLRDAHRGEPAVKGKGTYYLPKPGGMSDGDYLAYKTRAKWYPAIQRTVQGLAGALLRKPAHQEIPRDIEDHIQNITLTGLSLSSFVTMALQEILLMGRYGILLDYTQGKVPRRPKWSGWWAESIPLWITEIVQGEERLRAVILKEEVLLPKPEDPWHLEPVCQYRLHWLNADGIYEVQVYQQYAAQGLVPMGDPIIPVRRKEPLDFVPFQFMAPMHLTPEVRSSPVEGLMYLNFAYYRHSADYEHGLHLTALPTAVITGFSNDQIELAIGSQAVWQIPNADARVYFLEFHGAGLTSHQHVLEADKLDMATMGAKLLESPPETQETLGAVRLRHLGEQSTLASWGHVISQGLTQVLRWHAWWAGATEDRADDAVTYDLNTDFVAAPLPAQETIALMQVWQAGGMSLETFLWNLQQGERLPPGRTVEHEKALIETQAPAILPLGDDEGEEDEEEDQVALVGSAPA